MIPDPLAMIPMPARNANAAAEAAGRAPRLAGPLAWAWRDAQTDAALAYAAWCGDPGADTYAAYRAAQDRADVAQDMLSRGSPSATG